MEIDLAYIFIYLLNVIAHQAIMQLLNGILFMFKYQKLIIFSF